MRKGGLRVYWHLLSACLELYTWWETNIKKEMSIWLQPLLEGCLLFLKVVHHGIFINSILKYGFIISQIWLCTWFFSSRWDIYYRILLCWSLAIERKNTWGLEDQRKQKLEIEVVLWLTLWVVFCYLSVLLPFLLLFLFLLPSLFLLFFISLLLKMDFSHMIYSDYGLPSPYSQFLLTSPSMQIHPLPISYLIIT